MVQDRHGWQDCCRLSALLLVAALVLGLAHAAEGAADDTPRLRVLSWGGAYEAAQAQALFEPFTEATGIPVRVDAYAAADCRSCARLQTATGRRGMSST